MARENERYRKPVSISIEECQALMDEHGGLCVECGAEAYGVEPDARRYECEQCGARAVFGAEELLFMGAVR